MISHLPGLSLLPRQMRAYVAALIHPGKGFCRHFLDPELTTKNMTELDNAAAGDEDQEENDTGGEGEGNSENNAEEESEETKATKDQGGEGEGSDDDEEGEEDGDDEKKFEDTDEPEIPTRASSHIIARQRRKAQKLESKDSSSEEEESSESDDDDEGEADTGDEKPDPNAVSEEVSRQLQPITDKLVNDADEVELRELFAEEPNAKGYERAIRALMKKEALSQVPIAMIYSHLSRKHTLAEGARQKEVADAEAEETQGAGSQRRSTKVKSGGGKVPSVEEVDDMSDEDLDQLAHQVQAGKFVPKK